MRVIKITLMTAMLLMLAAPAFAVTDSDGNGATDINKGGTNATTAAGARTNLGVDAAGTDNSTDVTLTGTPDYITISGQVITRNAVDLTTDVTGVLPDANIDSAIARDSELPIVSNTAYDATSWNGNSDAATKDAIRDKIESMSTGSNGTDTGDVTLDGGTAVSSSDDDVIDGGTAS